MPEGKPLEEPPAAAPAPTTKLGDALSDGDAEALGDSVGAPPLGEAQPEVEPVRNGEDVVLPLRVPRALRESERVPEGEAPSWL